MSPSCDMYGSSILLALLVLGDAVIIIASHNCTGEHEYRDAADGLCKKCHSCPPGQQSKSYCGYGTRSSRYSCEMCPSGTYSCDLDYRRCRTCKPCERWNSVTTLECTAVNDRECGICHRGFFRLLKSDGTQDQECHPCLNLKGDNIKCDSNVGIGWTIFLAIAFGTLVLVVVMVAVIYFSCGRWNFCVEERRRKEREYDVEAEKRNICGRIGEDMQLISNQKPYQEEECTTDDGFEVTIMKMDQLTPGDISSQNDLLEGWLRPEPVVRSSCAEMVEGASNAKDLKKSCRSFSDVQSSVTYSDRPTIQCATSNGTLTYSHMPTDAFKLDCTPKLISSAQERHSLQCKKTHSKVNKRLKQQKVTSTSSSDSLLENVDRDSKNVVEQSMRTFSFDAVEFFDTESLTSGDRKKQCNDVESLLM